MELENVCHFVDVCTTVTPPPICKLVHGIRECVSGGPAQNVCNVEKQCHLQEMPKYCEVNCREVTVPRVK
ncbi:hypothetical protein, partial [Pseudomonas sp. MPBD4-3]|uniref:hypothetical protein n=1 Tax=Pseudomonas sp. MPBD4-3 TaxID=2070575 RepID=UPI001C477461